MIYFIECADAVKIGYSEDPRVRFGTLQTSTPHNLNWLGVMYGDMDTEARLHEAFSKHRIRGEWFRLTDEITDYINRHRMVDDSRYRPSDATETEVASILKRIGRDTLAEALDVGLTAISAASVANSFPASWYQVVLHLCAENDVDVSQDLFNWRKRVKAETKQGAA